MPSALPAVFDYLLGDDVKAALVAVNADVVVQDGWVDDLATDLFVVGAPDPNHADSSDDRQAYVSLPARLLQETFGVYCYFDIWRGGDDQSVARSAAVDLLDALAAHITSDPTLGGIVNGGATLSDVRLGGTQTDDEAGQGRRALLSFTLRCVNAYR